MNLPYGAGNVSAPKTSGVLLWSEWLAAVFGQETVDIGDVVDLCLDTGADDDVFKDGSRKGVACRFDELVCFRACEMERERKLDSGCL